MTTSNTTVLFQDSLETNFWKDVWPLILKSPLVLFSLSLAFLMGYGITFMLFGYRTETKFVGHIIRVVFGSGYAFLIFLITNWNLVLYHSSPLTMEDLGMNAPKTFVLSFAFLFVVMIVVVILRERKRN